jgi:hypothetical protein
MNFSQPFNLNTATQHPLFEPTYLNLQYIFNQILEFFKGILGIGPLSELGAFLKIVFFILTLIFVTVIIYCIVRLSEIREKEKKHLKEKIAEYAQKQAEKEKRISENGEQKNKRWERVSEYINSPVSSDWKLAIIEADAMLEELMNHLGFKGENLGEKLKQADRERYPTLNLAWEPHTLRNRIAHEGSELELPQYEAKRLVSIYERVFREFNYI